MGYYEAMCIPKGNACVILPKEGLQYQHEADGVRATIKLAPDLAPYFRYSLVTYTLEPRTEADLYAYRATDRILYWLSGGGTAHIDGVRYPVSTGSFIHCGRGRHIAVADDGAGSEIAVVGLPYGADARHDLLVSNDGGLPRLALSDEGLRLLGVLTRQQAEALPRDGLGELIVVGPDEGESYWQADPSPGYVQGKMGPTSSPIAHYSVGTQFLESGGAVREHGHNQLNELLIVVKGTVVACLEGEEATCPPGSVICIGRNKMHSWHTAGAEDVVVLGIIDPPGMDGALAVTGRLRVPGEPRPANIPRNAETGRILKEQFGFVIPGGGG